MTRKTYQISIHGKKGCDIKKKSVTGMVNINLSYRRDGAVYRVDHIPTGMSCGYFATAAGARGFIMEAERLCDLSFIDPIDVLEYSNILIDLRDKIRSGGRNGRK